MQDTKMQFIQTDAQGNPVVHGGVTETVAFAVGDADPANTGAPKAFHFNLFGTDGKLSGSIMIGAQDAAYLVSISSAIINSAG